MKASDSELRKPLLIWLHEPGRDLPTVEAIEDAHRHGTNQKQARWRGYPIEYILSQG